MKWSVFRSWQAPNQISTSCSVGNDFLISSGMDIILLDEECNVRWKRTMPFRVHGANHDSGRIGILYGHGFHILQVSDGSPINEGRSTEGGFSDILPRPGGGWVLSCRKGNLHIFSSEGRGIKRLSAGGVRRLIGWFDREHLMWQDENGKLRCAKLANEDSQRLLEDRVWSWVSRMDGGKILLQAADGMLWEGVPHPYGWDSLDTIDTRSLEPLAANKAGDGWWILSIEGSVHSMTQQISINLGNTDLGDFLVGLAPDTMVTIRRDGLVRVWQSPDLSNLRRIELQKMVAEAKVASDWEERRKIFKRACQAEDEGRISLAIDLYQSLGRTSDVNRLLSRLKGD